VGDSGWAPVASAIVGAKSGEVDNGLADPDQAGTVPG
jgi:hypothetical protein